MYKNIKKILTSIIPKKFLLKNELAFRKPYSLFYIGNKFHCNICQTKLRAFIKTENGNSICPACGSTQRDRRLWSFLQSGFLFKGILILDFSPSRCLYRLLKKTHKNNYQSTDLSGYFFADKQYDITNIAAENETYDLIICYHVLEHVEQDIKAINELYRIIKPNGKLIVQTPYKSGKIYENQLIIDPQERQAHFGQHDHVRIYSVEGLKERLELSGFKVSVYQFSNDPYNNGFDLNDTIIVSTK